MTKTWTSIVAVLEGNARLPEPTWPSAQSRRYHLLDAVPDSISAKGLDALDRRILVTSLELPRRAGELAERLGISFEVVLNRIDRLRSMGHLMEIDAHWHCTSKGRSLASVTHRCGECPLGRS